MGETLESALAAFEKQRSRIIADVIVELGRAAIEGFAPPKERTNMAFHKAWLARVDDPRLRTWCLDTLTTKLPRLSDGTETSFGDVIEALVQRLAALAKSAPDPRIARAMIARFELREPATNWVDVHDAMVPLVAQHADDSIAEAVKAPGLPEELLDLELPEPVTLKDAARWKVEKPAPRHDASAMLQAIYDAPDDDAPRSVYADMLQERGDPRGEFIALQLREARGEATDEMIERAQELAKEHGVTWLGTLRPIVYRAEMRRGFLTRLELAGSWASSKWDTYVDDPLLSTVEELDEGQAKSDILAKLIAGPRLRANLRAITVGANDLWQVVGTTPLPKLHTLRCYHWKRGDVAKRFTDDVLPFIERTKTITTVGCDLAFTKQFSKQLLARLTRFECHDELDEAYKFWTKMPKLRSLRCTYSDELELVRTANEEYIRLRVSKFFKDDGSRLLELPKKIKRVEVIGNAGFAKRARPVVGKRLELVERPAPSGFITGVKK